MAERTPAQLILNLVIGDDPITFANGYTVERALNCSARITPPAGKSFLVRDKTWHRAAARAVSAVTGERLVLTCRHCGKESKKPTCTTCAHAKSKAHIRQAREQAKMSKGAA